MNNINRYKESLKNYKMASNVIDFHSSKATKNKWPNVWKPNLELKPKAKITNKVPWNCLP